MSDPTPNVPEKRNNSAIESQPLSAESFRQSLLVAAGFDRPYQIKILTKVIQAAEIALEATKETPVTLRIRLPARFSCLHASSLPSLLRAMRLLTLRLVQLQGAGQLLPKGKT